LLCVIYISIKSIIFRSSENNMIISQHLNSGAMARQPGNLQRNLCCRTRKSIFALLLILFPVPGNAQISHGGTPMRSVLGPASVEWLDLPPVDKERLLLEDEWNALTGKKSRRVAEPVELSISPESYGTWEEYPEGRLVWRLGLRGVGAEALGLVFGRYALEEGTRIFIYDPSGEYLLGAYTRHNNKADGILPVSYLPGSELIIQMEVEPEYGGDYGELLISTVRRAYRPPVDKTSTGRGSIYALGPCHVDINCPQGTDWQSVKKSVVHLDAVENCTGVLINNTRQDGKAYIYTAAHCIFQGNQYRPPVVYFNYENSSCGGNDAQKNISMSGVVLVATGDTLENPRDADSLDFALLELSQPVSDTINTFFAGWDRSQAPAQETAAIHHPDSYPKKISVDLDAPGTDLHASDYWDAEGYIRQSFWRIYEWDVAATEWGSSGGPLFNQDLRVVGTLTGGPASCAVPENDYYTRFDYAWDYYPEPWKQLKHWLDPENTGVISLDGMEGPQNVVRKKSGCSVALIFPNPASTSLELRGGLIPGREAEIQVYDLAGKQLIVERRVWVESRSIDVSSLPAGLYILKYRQADRSGSTRLVISR
jgi:V8-like Glu-specific endopeptidase